jgi:hypothetical protein
MVIELPAYSGPSAECPKCGAHMKTEYHAVGIMWTEHMPTEQGFQQIDEHLYRLCPRCGYGWPEACVSESVVSGVEPCKTTT